jgi:hypothetical protein
MSFNLAFATSDYLVGLFSCGPLMFLTTEEGGSYYKSSDGLTWDPVPTPNYPTSKFTIFGYSGSLIYAGGDQTAGSSLDGVTWTSHQAYGPDGVTEVGFGLLGLGGGNGAPLIGQGPPMEESICISCATT